MRYLARDPANELVFITEENANVVPGVRKAVYRLPARLPDPAQPGGELGLAMVRAAAVAGVAGQLAALGFRPDIVIGHHGWGELLNLGDVWPDVKLLGYYEFFYRTVGLDVGFDPEFPMAPTGLPQVRAKNALNLLALANPGWGQTPTRFQFETYPEWAQRRIAVLPEGVDLDLCRPDPSLRARVIRVGSLELRPEDTLLTYVSRDLEPYRGFHVLMRALPALLRERSDLKAVLVGGDGVSYGARLPQGNWRERMLREVGGLDPARVTFPGKLDYASYLALLRRSDVHVYLTYPFVASWSLREALACGCLVAASDTAPVREFVADGVTGALFPFLEPRALAERVLGVLEDAEAASRLRAGARAFAERSLRLSDTLAAYVGLIGKVRAAG